MLGIDARGAGSAAPVRDVLDAAGLAVTIGLAGLIVEGTAGPARVMLAIAFAFFAPGRAIVANWPRFAYWSEFGMSVVLSLAALTLLAMVMLWTGRWHPVGLFEAEAAVTAVALVTGMIRRHRARPGPAGPQDDG